MILNNLIQHINNDEDRLYIDNIPVDFNPINEEDSGYTIDSWIKTNYDYNKE